MRLQWKQVTYRYTVFLGIFHSWMPGRGLKFTGDMNDGHVKTSKPLPHRGNLAMCILGYLLWLRDHLFRQIVFVRFVQSHQRSLVLPTRSLVAHPTGHTTSVLSKWNTTLDCSKGFEKDRGCGVGLVYLMYPIIFKLNRLLRSKN